MKQLKIYNGFGIKPTNTHVSAGMDFYVPDLTDADNETQGRFIDAMLKSHGITEQRFVKLVNIFNKYLMSGVAQTQRLNIIQLYLSLYSYDIESFKHEDDINAVPIFINDYLVFDKNGVAGVKLKLNDTLFINSGIKVALEHGTAGVFLNKSGKGKAGFDVRAQVVDEDYSGYVHLSIAMTKKHHRVDKNIVYCGDKLVQMLILRVEHLDPIEISQEAYDDIMKDSERGADGFGSSDVKH